MALPMTAKFLNPLAADPENPALRLAAADLAAATGDSVPRRQRSPWSRIRPILGGIITVLIFVWILKPIVRSWPQVSQRVLATNWYRVAGASVLFAAFLFFFRALAWRRILISFGHRLPVAASTRIWSTSELARYLPGVIWQVVGRAYLARPYGVSGAVCSTSQILELAVFLLANLITAICCLMFMGFRHLHGMARIWLILSAALVPLLLYVLHPNVFYPLVNRILARFKKPPIETSLQYGQLLRLLTWSILGLLLQGIAIFLVVFRLLDLPLAKWWLVTGAYCLAWCAGFLAVWAPGGLGVREAVFIAAMNFALSHAVRHGQIGDPEQKKLFLLFLSVLLRIWATVGELILAAIAYAFDLDGALGRRPKRLSAPSGAADIQTDAPHPIAVAARV